MEGNKANYIENIPTSTNEISINNKKKYLFVSTSNIILYYIRKQLPVVYYNIDNFNKYILDNKEIYVLTDSEHCGEFMSKIINISNLSSGNILFDKIFILCSKKNIECDEFIKYLKIIGKNKVKNITDLIIFLQGAMTQYLSDYFDLKLVNFVVKKNYFKNFFKLYSQVQKISITNDETSDNLLCVDFSRTNQNSYNLELYLNYVEKIQLFNENSKFIFNEIEQNKQQIVEAVEINSLSLSSAPSLK